jgi:hypothetical protein
MRIADGRGAKAAVAVVVRSRAVVRRGEMVKQRHLLKVGRRVAEEWGAIRWD